MARPCAVCTKGPELVRLRYDGHRHQWLCDGCWANQQPGPGPRDLDDTLVLRVDRRATRPKPAPTEDP